MHYAPMGRMKLKNYYAKVVHLSRWIYTVYVSFLRVSYESSLKMYITILVVFNSIICTY